MAKVRKKKPRPHQEEFRIPIEVASCLEALLLASFAPFWAARPWGDGTMLNAEAEDALAQRACLWTQLQWEWAVETGEVPLEACAELEGNSAPADHAVDCTGFYNVLAMVSELVELETSVPLRAHTVQGQPCTLEDLVPEVLQPMQMFEGQRSHLSSRSEWQPISFVPVDADEVDSDEPEDLPVFGVPAICHGTFTAGEYWIRITERCLRVLRRHLPGTLRTLAILANGRAQLFQDRLHEQQPRLNAKQANIINDYVESCTRRASLWSMAADDLEQTRPASKRVERQCELLSVLKRRPDLERKHRERGRSVKTANSSFTRPKVFISYSHVDSEWVRRIQIMLKPLVRDDQIALWDDTRIKSGDVWRKEIEENLQNASVAILLVSPHFLASDFIHDHELQPILQKAQERGLTVLWLLLSHCLSSRAGVHDYQALHDISRPLESLSAAEQNRILYELAKRVDELTSMG